MMPPKVRDCSFCGELGKKEERGFTIIELLFVMAIVGMLAATAVLRFGGLPQKAGLEWMIGRLENLDGSLRQHAALHHRRTMLALDLGTGQIKRIYGSGKSDSLSFNLGPQTVISRFVSANKDTSTGQVQIDYSANGQTQTFAINIKSRTNKLASAWLLFAGTTGQMTRWENEQDVLQVLQKTGPKGTDSH